MLSIVMHKELKAILLSPKFVLTFAVCTLLILLSVFIGIEEYRTALRHYEAGLQLTDQSLRTESSWMGLSTALYRRPDPVRILVTGVSNDVGRTSAIDRTSGTKLTNSAYADEPIYALFRSVDLAFIVTVVLSLFAILFTYDAINGEREGGTLRLTFANPIPRSTYIFAKLLGSWTGLVIPLLVPILLALLLVFLSGIPLSVEEWGRVGAFLGMSLLYFTFWIAVGILISALTRRSAVSFLVCLVAWVTLVLIVPRLSVMVAGALRPVPTVAEVEGQQDAFAKDQWQEYTEYLEAQWRKREEPTAGLSKDERERYRDAHLPEWMEQDDAHRTQVQKDIEAFSVRLNEDQRNRKQEQEHLALLLTRMSPASAYQLAAMNLGGTDIGLKARTEDAMGEYRTRFLQYTEKKQKETGGVGGFRITVDSEKGVTFTAPRETGALDLSDMPVFFPSPVRLGDIAAQVMVDAGILVFASLVAFGGAFLGFLRYDVR